MHRRRFLILGGSGAALTLAGCQSILPFGAGGGATSNAARLLADIRENRGLERLSPDGALETAALEQSRYMAVAGVMNHDTGWRKDFPARLRKHDIGGVAAENIAHGRFDVERVIAVWMESPPHRRNMLDPRFARFGLAFAEETEDSDRRYWAAIFASA